MCVIVRSFLIQNLVFKGNIIFILRNQRAKQFFFIQGYRTKMLFKYFEYRIYFFSQIGQNEIYFFSVFYIILFNKLILKLYKFPYITK